MVSEKSSNRIFDKWSGWLETIYKDIQNLLIKRDIFREVQEIVRANPRIHKPSHFYDWLGSVYTTDAVIGIRRQLDLDKRSISFKRLLTDILNHPEVLSRDRYVKLYPKFKMRPDMGTRDFDSIAGSGQAHIPVELVTADIAELEKKAQKISHYATKRIAHFDEEGPNEPVASADLEECLDYLEELLKKYFLIFHATHIASIVPVFQYDWKHVFREPWILPSTSDQ